MEAPEASFSLPARRRAAALLAISAVAGDWGLVWLRHEPITHDGRWTLALASAAGLIWLANGDLAALGLRTHAGAIRQAGARPLLLASLLFCVLVAGGYALNLLVARLG